MLFVETDFSTQMQGTFLWGALLGSLTVSRTLNLRKQGKLPVNVLALPFILVLLITGLCKEICVKRTG